MNKNKAVELKKGESLEEFRARLRKETGLSVESAVGFDSGPVVVPVVSSAVVETKTDQDVDSMKYQAKEKSVEAGAVEPVVSKAVSDVSFADVEKLIVKKKTRLFGKHEKLEDLSISDLEILRQQKIKEEQAEANRLKDEAILAELRADKKEHYQRLREWFHQSGSFAARAGNFIGLVFLTRPGYGRRSPEELLRDLALLGELCGVQIVEKKHFVPFTPEQFEDFHIRWASTNRSSFFDTYAISAMHQLGECRRRELIKEV